MGTRTVVSSGNGWSEQQLQNLDVALTDISSNLGSVNVTSHAAIPNVDHQVLVASNGRRGESIHWRLTISPEVQSVRAVFLDGATQQLSCPSGEVGVWFSHPTSRTVVNFIIERQTSGGSSTASSGGSGGSSGSASGGSSTASSGGSGGSSGSASGGSSTASSGGSGGSSGSASGGSSTTSSGGSATPPFVILSDSAGTATASGQQVPKYLIIYQNDVDPSAVSGTIDIPRVIAGIKREIDAGRSQPWGVLDFEDPFNEVMDHGPSDPRFATAMQSLVNTIRAVKAAFPSIAWTYYNFPRVAYWNSNRGWDAIPETESIALQEEALTRYAPMLPELDWFMPSIYDRYEKSLFSPSMVPVICGAERAYRATCVGFIKRYMARDGVVRRPIIPIACPWFIEGGRATLARSIPVEELVEDQFRPVIVAGADGIAMWCAIDWVMVVATTPAANLPERYWPEQQAVRNQFVIDLFGGAPVNWDTASTINELRTKLDSMIDTAIGSARSTYDEVHPGGASPSPSPSS